MITIDLRNAAGLAAAEYLDRSAPAPAAQRAAPAASPLLAGIAPARPLAIARQPARARKARSARRSSAGYAQARAASKPAAPKTSSAAKASGTSRSSSSSRASATDPLAFLKDPKLTIEEKLMKLLGYMDQRWEKEMQAKMDQIAASEREKKQQASKSSSSGGGILGVARDVVAKAIGAPAGGVLEALTKLPSAPDFVGTLVSELGGPALAAGAAALGFPELAPVLVKLGPQLGKLAKGWVADATGAGGGGNGSGSSASKSASSSSTGSSGSSSGGSKALSDSEQQVLVMEIQRIQQQQKEMFGLVSNVLKANHDARMSVVNNIR